MTRRYIDPSKMPGADFTKVLTPLRRSAPIDAAIAAAADAAGDVPDRHAAAG